MSPPGANGQVPAGEIRTCSDYESHWYSLEQIAGWTRDLWGSGSCHFATHALDVLRAEPAQLAVLDPGGHLRPLLASWGIALWN